MREELMCPSWDRCVPFNGLKYASISFLSTVLSDCFILADSPPAAPPFAAATAA